MSKSVKNPTPPSSGSPSIPVSRPAATQAPQTFVNLAPANHVTIRPDSTTIVRPESAAIRPQLQVTAMSSPGVNNIQHLSGAINLTITNGNIGAVNLRGAASGAVNLRGAGPGAVNLRGATPVTVRQDVLQGGQAVIRANISGPGALQRIPLQLQNPAGMKLNPIKLHPFNINTGVNLRLAVPSGGAPVAAGHKPNLVSIRQLSPPTSVLQQVNIPVQSMQRMSLIPLQGGNKFPITHLQPLTLRPVTTQHTVNALPVSVAAIQAAIPTMTTATFVKKPESAVVYAKQIMSKPAELLPKDLSKSVRVKTKPTILPKKDKEKGNKLREDENMYDEYYLMDKQGALHYRRELKPKYYRDIKQDDGTILRSKNVEGFKPGPDDYISVEEQKRVENLKATCEVVSLKEGKQMLAERQKKDEEGLDLSKKDTKVEDENGASESDGESSDTDKSEEDDESSSEESEEDKEDEALDEENPLARSGDEEMPEPSSDIAGEAAVGDDGLEWKDGIGTLPGSDIRFRKNEFGILEMITDMDDNTGSMDVPPEDNGTASAGIEKGADICCCETCGIHGMSGDFLNGGRFCSRRCVSIHASRRGAAARQKAADTSNLLGAKRKKRKISAESEDVTGNKIPRLKVDDDALSTGSTESTPKKLDDPVAMKSKTTVPPGGKRGRSFSWNVYLEQENAIAAPNKLFREYQDIPSNKNLFKVGMRLEAIDPRLPALYCVVTVVELRGYRIRLHFDGYDGYDFWTNADSPFIFPMGWSEKNGKALQAPKAYVGKCFDWVDYLKLQRSSAAPKSLFSTVSGTSVTPHGFRVGMKLEAVDKKNSSLICVATVADVLGNNILVHFDGWDSVYDYWCDPTSPYIHPVGWCQENNVALSPPQEWKDVDSFTWEEYLEIEKATAVPARAFKPRNLHGFEVGMRLEVVDRRNPILVRAATVAEVEAYSFKVHFDGWSDMYDYFVDDDSPDVHPCGWCAKTGHPLTPPLTTKDLMVVKNEGCPTPGCTGIGHIKGSKYIGHHSAFGCPYTVANMNKDNALSDRLMFRPDLEIYRKGRKPSEPPSPFDRKDRTISPDFSTLTIKTEFDAGLTNHILENGGRPLYGKGSGRGRKKTIVKLMQEVEQLRAKANAHQLQQQSSFQPVHNPTHLTNGIVDVTSPPIHSFQFPMTNGTLEGPGAIHHSVFTPTPAPHPYHDLPLAWEQHNTKLLPDILQYKAQDVSEWNAQQVAEFVGRLPGCQKVALELQEQQVDGEALLLLNQADLVRVLNIKLGPALKIHNTILTLKNNLDV